MKMLTKMKILFVSKTHMIFCALFLIIYIPFSPLSLDFAEDEVTADQETLDVIDEEIKWLQAETYVITPSRIPEKIKKAASSITVVTDKQIRQMGAKDIADVLMLAVPSFSIYRSVEAMNLICVRGPCTTNLMMINSLPLYGVGTQGSVPYGYPKPGTNFLVELTYEF